MKVLEQISRTLKAIKFSAKACKVLLCDQAFFASVQEGELRDREKNYLPWFTYPAIEALNNWDLSDKRVFEYGSGFSTLFWASRAKEVVSVEHDRTWYELVSKLAPDDVRLILAPIDKDESYPSRELRDQFDTPTRARSTAALTSSSLMARHGHVSGINVRRARCRISSQTA